MNISGIIFTLLMVIIWLYILRHSIASCDAGEQVDCSKTDSVREKLDTLYNLAMFEQHRVRWRTFFLGGAVGSLLSLYLLNSMKTSSSIVKYLVILLPTFIILQLIANFESYHGEHRKHPAHALRLRLDLQQLCSYDKTTII